MKLKTKNLIIIALVLFIISQIFMVFFILEKRQETVKLIQELDEKIQLNNKETQSKINSLTESISSISSEQSSLQEQLGEIKAETSADFSGIIDKEVKGVVTIKTDVSQGSGFLITNNGFVVTNAHVLSGASLANIYTYDNKVYSASLIGYSPSNQMDLALLKIQGDFFSLTLGDSDDVKIGEKVIAIGNPLGLSFTATEGIISARDREGINNLPYYFQTDVSLNPGNSGGPLINTKGDVIGINNFKISGAENIGFALEINPAKDTINDISLQALNQSIV
jgi:S1-C subfamily serine protease